MGSGASQMQDAFIRSCVENSLPAGPFEVIRMTAPNTQDEVMYSIMYNRPEPALRTEVASVYAAFERDHTQFSIYFTNPQTSVVTPRDDGAYDLSFAGETFIITHRLDFSVNGRGNMQRILLPIMSVSPGHIPRERVMELFRIFTALCRDIHWTMAILPMRIERVLPLYMGSHPRLGEHSLVCTLDPELLRIVARNSLAFE